MRPRIHLDLYDEDPSHHEQTIAYFEVTGEDLPEEISAAEYAHELSVTLTVEIPGQESARYHLAIVEEPIAEPTTEP